MNSKSAIINLLNNEKLNDDQLAIKLKEHYKKDSESLNQAFMLHRTILHMLFVKRRKTTLLCFIEDSEYDEVATKTDKQGKNLMHYIMQVEEEVDYELLTVLCEKFPSMVNQQDKTNKQTPLHQAVIKEDFKAIEIIIQSGCADLTLKDAKGMTAIEIASKDKQLLGALFFVKSASKAPVIVPPLKLSALYQEFPLLTARSSERCSSNLSSHSLLSRSSSDISLLSNSCDSSTPSKIKRPHQILPIKEWLVMLNLSKANDSEKNFEKKLHQVIIFFSEEEFIEAEHKKILQEMANLYPDLMNLILELLGTVNQFSTEKHLQKLDKWDIEYQGLLEREMLQYANTYSQPDFSNHEKDKKELYELIWQLIHHCLEEKKLPGEELLLGLQAYSDMRLIIMAVRAMMESLSPLEKLTANYMVFKLIILNQAFISEATSLKLQLVFLSRAISKDHSKVIIPNDLVVEKLETLKNIITHFHSQPIKKNYSKLQSWVIEARESDLTFNALFDKALQERAGNRTGLVEELASRMREVTLYFYDQVQLGEFLPAAISEKNRQQQAPNIAAQQTYFNQFCAYLVTKIVNQPAANIPNALKLIIEISVALCPIDKASMKDINSVMIMMAALNHVNVSRLSKFFGQLSSKESALLTELKKLVDHHSNYKWMKSLSSFSPSTLPFPGMLLQSMTFSYEGQSLLNAIQVSGKVLCDIVNVKKEISVLNFNQQPGLLDEMKDIKTIDEERCYSASLRLQPIRSDILYLGPEVKEIESTLDVLLEQYLAREILPATLVESSVSFNEVEDFFGVLYRWTSNLLIINKEKTTKKEQLKILEKANIAFNKLAVIINSHYEKANVNPLYISANLQELAKKMGVSKFNAKTALQSWSYKSDFFSPQLEESGNVGSSSRIEAII